MAMNLQRVGRWLKSANGTATSPNWALIAGTFWCGRFSKPSSRPSSCMISSVEGWMVSPRKSRRNHLAPRPIGTEADAGARQAAADADRRAVGAPAGGAGHRAVDGEFDGIHPAGDMRFDRDVVAALAQRLADALREGFLDLDG